MKPDPKAHCTRLCVCELLINQKLIFEYAFIGAVHVLRFIFRRNVRSDSLTACVKRQKACTYFHAAKFPCQYLSVEYALEVFCYAILLWLTGERNSFSRNEKKKTREKADIVHVVRQIFKCYHIV